MNCVEAEALLRSKLTEQFPDKEIRVEVYDGAKIPTAGEDLSGMFYAKVRVDGLGWFGFIHKGCVRRAAFMLPNKFKGGGQDEQS